MKPAGSSWGIEFCLLCYLSLTIPIAIFCGRTVFGLSLILNLFYDDIIIFYCYKLTVGFNLSQVSAAFGGIILSVMQLFNFMAEIKNDSLKAHRKHKEMWDKWM